MHSRRAPLILDGSPKLVPRVELWYGRDRWKIGRRRGPRARRAVRTPDNIFYDGAVMNSVGSAGSCTLKRMGARSVRWWEADSILEGNFWPIVMALNGASVRHPPDDRFQTQALG